MQTVKLSLSSFVRLSSSFRSFESGLFEAVIHSPISSELDVRHFGDVFFVCRHLISFLRSALLAASVSTRLFILCAIRLHHSSHRPVHSFFSHLFFFPLVWPASGRSLFGRCFRFERASGSLSIFRYLHIQLPTDLKC